GRGVHRLLGRGTRTARGATSRRLDCRHGRSSSAATSARIYRLMSPGRRSSTVWEGAEILRTPPNPRPLNVLSFDLEDWYQVLYFDDVLPPSQWSAQPSRLPSVTARLLNILDEHRTRATFFVLAWNAERMPHLVEAIQQRGHEIGSHGFWHRLVHRQTPKTFAEDLKRSLDILRSITAQQVKGYRAPS